MAPADGESLDALRESLAREAGVPPAEVRALVSPYRICPVGAHIDHQGGPLLGMAVDAATRLVFVASDTVDVTSRNFEGRVRFDPAAPGADEGPAWGRYLRASLAAIRDRLPPRPRGFRAIVAGRLPGSGLSSSASVLLAYLSAWAEVNDVELTPGELVRLSLAAENEHVGIRCGVLDPVCVVGSRRGHMLAIDSLEPSWEPIPLGPAGPEHAFLVAFTGTERSLLSTDFNLRVEQCIEAARWVAEARGVSDARRLGDLDRELLRDSLADIPGEPGRRARHFVEECDRVARARDLWRGGDLAAFGAVMSDSCRSSIENYETGSPELIALQSIWQSTEGVLGARFSGAGFGGCSVALVVREALEPVAASVRRRFVEAFPALADRARMLEVRSHEGLAFR